MARAAHSGGLQSFETKKQQQQELRMGGKEKQIAAREQVPPEARVDSRHRVQRARLAERLLCYPTSLLAGSQANGVKCALATVTPNNIHWNIQEPSRNVTVQRA